METILKHKAPLLLFFGPFVGDSPSITSKMEPLGMAGQGPPPAPSQPWVHLSPPHTPPPPGQQLRSHPGTLLFPSLCLWTSHSPAWNACCYSLLPVKSYSILKTQPRRNLFLRPSLIPPGTVKQSHQASNTTALGSLPLDPSRPRDYKPLKDCFRRYR